MLAVLQRLFSVQYRGTPRNDLLVTSPYNDKVDALAGNDTVRSGNGDDTIRGGAGNDLILGGAGTDTAVFSGSVHNYSWRPDPANPLNPLVGLPNDMIRISGRDGIDRLGGIEILKFDDATIYLTPANRAPVSVADGFTVSEDAVLSVPAAAGVLANDSDADGNALTAVLVSGVSHGSLSLAANGSFVYTPDANFFGADSFTYKANDGTADGNTVTVSLTVTAINDAPVAVADSYIVAEDDTLTVAVASGVLVNDSDADDDALTAVLVADVAHGSLTLSADGSFVYTPAADFFGADS
ncbi:MAG: tandem-95 repeat protein, partial [Rhizobiaceae bacterium]|nr:tandem-95 repeat protein [Rhizobiaceae bacterium]